MLGTVRLIPQLGADSDISYFTININIWALSPSLSVSSLDLISENLCAHEEIKKNNHTSSIEDEAVGEM